MSNYHMKEVNFHNQTLSRIELSLAALAQFNPQPEKD